MTGKTWECPVHSIVYGDFDGRPVHHEYRCPSCRQDDINAEQHFRQEHARFRWWQRSAGVPHRYRRATAAAIQPATPSARTLRTAVASYIGSIDQHTEVGRGLALFGPPGTGKTLALCAIVNAACALTRGPRYVSWPSALAQVKASYSGPQDSPGRRLLGDLAECPLLALDELGVRQLSEHDHAALFELVDHRYSECLATLIASNVPQDQLGNVVGERTADRLREMCVPIATSGTSQRGHIAIAGPDALPEPPAKLVIRTHEHGAWHVREIEANP